MQYLKKYNIIIINMYKNFSVKKSIKGIQMSNSHQKTIRRFYTNKQLLKLAMRTKVTSQLYSAKNIKNIRNMIF